MEKAGKRTFAFLSLLRSRDKATRETLAQNGDNVHACALVFPGNFAPCFSLAIIMNGAGSGNGQKIKLNLLHVKRVPQIF